MLKSIRTAEHAGNFLLPLISLNRFKTGSRTPIRFYLSDHNLGTRTGCHLRQM